MSGSNRDELKPDEAARVADVDARRLWRIWGLVVAVYWPGTRWISVAALGADSRAPTRRVFIKHKGGGEHGERTGCVGIALKTLAWNTNYSWRRLGI